MAPKTSSATGDGGIMEPDSVPVELTAEELWMLHDLVRHDQDAISEKKWPVVSTELNEQVALAIVACEDSKLKSYTLLLSAGDILLLDYVVRRDMKTPEGAKGKDILLKLFRARRDLAIGPVADTYNDTTYKAALDRKTVEAAGEVADEVIEEFSKEDQEDASTDTEPDDGADENAD
jgi:hypothetical protein